MIKIAIAGIGAIGGYFGGLLAKRYAGSASVQVYFIARGENEKVIQQQGLLVDAASGSFTATPYLCTSDCNNIGAVDYLVICSKGYSLADLLEQVKPCLKPETVILPLLNGVEAWEIINATYPQQEVWQGFAYLVARLTAPGVVKETGSVRQLHFGSLEGSQEKLEAFETLLKNAGIDARLSGNIESAAWEKYLFIVVMATLTAYLDKNFGQVRSDPQAIQLFDALLQEAVQLAQLKGIQFEGDILAKTNAKVVAANADTTSSMHSDFKKGGATELESITGYLVREARLRHLAVPTFDKLYTALKART